MIFMTKDDKTQKVVIGFATDCKKYFNCWTDI